MEYPYKAHPSDFRNWEQHHHAYDYVLYKQNPVDDVVFALNKRPRSERMKAKGVTLDPSPMKLIAKRAFPQAIQASGRFHVQRLMNEAVSDLHVDCRLQAIDLAIEST